MWRLVSIITFLGIFTTASGFSSPGQQSTTTRQNSVVRFATSSNDKVHQPSSVTTRMANDQEGEEIEKSTSDEAVSALTGTNGDASPVLSVTNGDSADPVASSANGDPMTAAVDPPKDAAESDDSKKSAFALILLPTLLFKFAIVMLVKFATDIVVFPLLFLYRMARLGKRKFIRGVGKVFGGKKDDIDASLEVTLNGDSTNTAPPS